MTSPPTLRERLLDRRQLVMLYGTTPPRADSPPDRVARAADRLAERVRDLTLDGLVVYDVQDESARTDALRPFPFLPTGESRSYARLLQAITGLTAVAYKCVIDMSEAGWRTWLAETCAAYGIGYLSLVGSASPTPAPGSLPVDRALQIAAEADDLTLGGVVIAERHTPADDESRRLIRKVAQGCRYFVSQVVYAPAPMRRLLADYTQSCRDHGQDPQRIVLTFSPCGRPQTLAFIKWLGVAITPATERAILDDPAPFTRSIRICCENLRMLLDQGVAEDVPIGINVESVSIHKDEIDASIELVHALREVAREYGLH